MLLVLYMEYLWRCAQHPEISTLVFDYKTWLDAVTAASEDEGIPIEELCAPPPEQYR